MRVAVVSAAAIIVVGVIISPYLAITNVASSSTKTTLVAAEIGSCLDTTAYAGLDSTANGESTSGAFGILAMPTNSVGELCVTYADNQTVSTTIGVCSSCAGGLRIGKYSVTNGESLFNQSSDVLIAANQTSITIGGSSPAKVTVAFMILADANSKGFYFLSVGYLGPVVCGVEFPFAVGYSFTEANETGPYFGLHGYRAGCYEGEGQVYSQVSGVMGIQVTQIDCGLALCDISP